MGFEQLEYSPPQSAASQQQSPEKHKLISHSKQEDKKALRSLQFSSSADHLVILCVCCLLSSHVQEKPLKALTGRQ